MTETLPRRGHWLFEAAETLLLWQVRDARGRRVGRCKEWAKVVGVDQVDGRVLAMRHKYQPCGGTPKVQKAIKPERVMTYRLASHASEEAELYCHDWHKVTGLVG